MDKALITGASSGIGYELADIMAAQGHDLILISQNKTQIEKVAKQLEEKHGVRIKGIAADLSKVGSAKKLFDRTKSDGVSILVNNAGVGLRGDFLEEDIARNEAMAHLNMISVMQLSHYFGKEFAKQKRGKILNTTSIVAFFPGPKQPVYYASKAFVRSLSRAMSYNLKKSNVTVTALHPGITKTNFFKTADAGSFKGGTSPRSVAELGYKAMMAGKTEVTHGLWNKFLTNVFVRIVPYGLQPLIVDRSSEV